MNFEGIPIEFEYGDFIHYYELEQIAVKIKEFMINLTYI